MLVAWLPILGAAVAGYAGYKGAKQTNRVNQREAAKNRLFQERMRNTQWQAAIEDMRAAGLNPALAYSQGPAAAPGGATAAPAENPVSSALQAVQIRKSLQLMDAQVTKTRAEGRASKAIADRETARNRAYGFQVRRDGSIRFDYDMPGLLKLVEAEINGAQAAASSASAQAARANAQAEILGPQSEVMSRLSQLLERLFNAGGPALQKILHRR